MDGNRRWSQGVGRLALYGYQQGVKALQKSIGLCRCWHIRALTVRAAFTASTLVLERRSHLCGGAKGT